MTSVPPDFNTEVTEMLGALRVKSLPATEHTEPLFEEDTSVRA